MQMEEDARRASAQPENRGRGPTPSRGRTGGEASQSPAQRREPRAAFQETSVREVRREVPGPAPLPQAASKPRD